MDESTLDEQAVHVDAAQLYEHLQAVIRDSEALLKATAAYAGDKVEGARAQVQASLQSAKERLAGVQDTVMSQARDFVSTGTDYVSDNPWKSVGIAAAVGFLLGAFFTRSSSSGRDG